MRSVSIKGLNDQIKIELGGMVELIDAVINKGKAEDYLIYSLTLNGKALKEFVLQVAPDKMDKLKDIIDQNEYKITAYDW